MSAVHTASRSARARVGRVAARSRPAAGPPSTQDCGCSAGARRLRRRAGQGAAQQRSSTSRPSSTRACRSIASRSARTPSVWRCGLARPRAHAPPPRSGARLPPRASRPRVSGCQGQITMWRSATAAALSVCSRKRLRLPGSERPHRPRPRPVSTARSCGSCALRLGGEQCLERQRARLYIELQDLVVGQPRGELAERDRDALRFALVQHQRVDDRGLDEPHVGAVLAHHQAVGVDRSDREHIARPRRRPPHAPHPRATGGRQVGRFALEYACGVAVELDAGRVRARRAGSWELVRVQAPAHAVAQHRGELPARRSPTHTSSRPGRRSTACTARSPPSPATPPRQRGRSPGPRRRGSRPTDAA